MEYGEFGGYGLLEARLGPFLRKDAPAPSGWVILGWVGRQFIMCQGQNDVNTLSKFSGTHSHFSAYFRDVSGSTPERNTRSYEPLNMI